jgi:hypothetical protein
MPASLLTQKELQLVLKAVIASRSVAELDRLLEACHEFRTFGSLQTYERYFGKDLAYREFKVHIPYVRHSNNTLTEAHIQFKRPSKFPAPYFNRNKTLLKELDVFLASLLGGRQASRSIYGLRCHHYGQYFGVQEKDDRTSTGWECTLIDEPHSSGQADPSSSGIRNDFVIVRYANAVHSPGLVTDAVCPVR